MRRLAALALLTTVAYLGFYGVLRAVQSEQWECDGRTYAIFPRDVPALYHLFRHLYYVDAAATGRGAHTGPHREVVE